MVDRITYEMENMLPSADTEVRPEDRPFYGKDDFTAAKFAEDSWEAAKERFMDAGKTDVDPNDPALFNAYKRSVDYLKDTGFAGLDLADAAFKYAVATVSQVMPTEQQEKRMARDLYSMPDAFLGAAGAKSLTQLDDAVDTAAAATKQVVSKIPEYDPTTTRIFAGAMAKSSPNMRDKDIPASKRSPENVFEQEDVPPEEQWGQPELDILRANKGNKAFSASEDLTPKDFGYRVDNPSEDWVKRKQEIAEQYAKDGGPASQKLLSGPQTAFLGTNPDKPLFLDTDFLSSLKGANDEVVGPSNSKYRQLKESVEKEGFKPDQKGNAIVIGINHKGEAFIMEGNNRVGVAKEFNVPNLRVEVKYFNGAEDVDSPYSPKNILKFANKEPRQFAEGGAVGDMNNQMEMAFMQEPEQKGYAEGGEVGAEQGTVVGVDPVSGNEVPAGSMPEEVRDDIPAMLSEGEYVVPADVVRYYGVKFFEDLRAEAKMGLTDMEANGRIGGEPVGEDLENEEMDELDKILMQFAEEGSLNIEEEDQGFAVGGVVEPMGGEPTGADALVERVMSAVQNNPTLQQELSSKGIQISRTTPQMQPEQMGQGNPPEEARKAFAEGGMSMTDMYPFNQNTQINTQPTIDPFAPTDVSGQFGVLGGSYFQPSQGVSTQPVKPKCPPGQVYDEVKKMCVPVQQQAPKNNDDDGGPDVIPQPAGEGEDGVGFGDWAKEVDWSNPSGWVDENLSGLSEMQEKGAKALGAVVGGPLGLVASGLPAASDLRNVAKIKAMQQVYEAAGMEAEASILGDKLDAYIKESPKIVDFVDGIIATGKGEKKNILKSLGLDENETNADVIRGALQGAGSKATPKPKPTPKPKDDSDRGSRSKPTRVSGPSTTPSTRPKARPEKPKPTTPTATTGGGMTGSDTRTDDPRGEGQYGGQSTSAPVSSGQAASDSYKDQEDKDTGLLNKGGLIKRRKKK